MDNEFNVDLITLISDEGEEIEFEILDIIENPPNNVSTKLNSKAPINSQLRAPIIIRVSAK